MSSVDIIQLVTTFLAGVLVLWEQWKGKSPWKSWRLYIAGTLLLFSLVVVWVSAHTASEQEREHRADLLLIQKQNTALNSLWIELQLQPHNNTLDRGCNLQIETYSQVAATLVRSGLIAEYISFQFRQDTGWYRDSRWTQAWPGIRLETDTVQHTVRFEMAPFGIRTQKGEMLIWKAERVADISLVRFGFQLFYGADQPDANNLAAWVEPVVPDLSWNPVKSICIYANSCVPDNLVTRLVPMVRSYGDAHDVIYFHPEGQDITDHDNFHFYPDMFEMRVHILRFLNSGNQSKQAL